MLSLKSGVVGAAVASLFGMAIVVGCAGSSSDDGDPVINTPHNDPADGGKGSVKLPPSGKSSSSSSSSSGDSTRGDDDDMSSSSSSSSSSGAVVVDAGKDSGPPPPAPGDSCSVQDTTYSRTCGHCGSQTALCTTGSGSGLTVSDYGPCGNEHGVCSTGDTKPCGNCGVSTCNATCGWGTCQNQGVCKAGVITHDPAGCATAGEYRSKVCSDQCTLGNFSGCAKAEVIVPDVGSTSMTQWELPTTTNGKKTSACKKTAIVTPVPVMPVWLTNPTSTPAVVQIWNSSAGTSIDTLLYTYDSGVLPTTDDDWRACSTEPVDGCASTLQSICTADGPGDFAGMDNVTIPANSSVVVITAGYTSTQHGKFLLNIKTKSH